MFPITNAAGTSTPTLGAVIPVGSNLQAIAADRVSNIWVAGSTVTDTTITPNVYVITKGTSTVTAVTGLTLASGAQILTGSGDLTGYITAQPTATARYTYLHDTAITGAPPLRPFSGVPSAALRSPRYSLQQPFLLDAC